MEGEYEQLKEDVLDEMEAIEQVLKDLSSLKNNLSSNKIDNTQKAAMGTFLMNFYVGVENIVKRISKEYYQTMPKGDSWHKELLDLSHNPPQGKSPVFDKNIVDSCHMKILNSIGSVPMLMSDERANERKSPTGIRYPPLLFFHHT